MSTEAQKPPAGPELGAVHGSPSAGSRWQIMSLKQPGEVHCHIKVCSFTPLVKGANGGGLFVKYFALGKRGAIACMCSLPEWRDLVNGGRIREANAGGEGPPP